MLKDQLPRHGIALHVYGMLGDDLIVIDTDANTLRWAQHSTRADRKPSDKTRPLTGAERTRFGRLADQAWRESPAGKEPRVTDVAEYLEIADGDDVFAVQTTLFDASWRPAATELVGAIADATWARGTK